MDIYTLFFLIILILSVIIHEVAHGFAAAFLGDPTARLQGRLTLNPLPHIDPLGSVIVPALLVFLNAGFLFGWAKPVPYNPYNLRNQKWGEAIVAAAGPGVNILLALLFGLLLRFGYGTLSPTFIGFTAVVVFVNIMLAFFNLLPIPPLDGSKLLRTLLPYKANMAFQRFEAFIMTGGLLTMVLIFWIFIEIVGPVFHSAIAGVFTLITGIPFSAIF